MIIYAGKQLDNGQTQVTVTRLNAEGKQIESYPLRVVEYHANEFAWGYRGSGPATLALSILAHHLGETWVNRTYLMNIKTMKEVPLCWTFHQPFKRNIIALLDRDQPWELTNVQVSNWLTSYALANKPEYASANKPEQESE